MIWYREPSGDMRMRYVLKESAGAYGNGRDVDCFIAEPSFSARLSTAVAKHGIPFDSVFKAYVSINTGRFLRTVEFRQSTSSSTEAPLLFKVPQNRKWRDSSAHQSRL
jgi:hypothetical protein